MNNLDNNPNNNNNNIIIEKGDNKKKIRIKFYSILLITSIIASISPFIIWAPSSGWGMAGYFIYYIWFAIIIIDIIIVTFFEFRHIKSQINFNSQKNIAKVYILIALIIFIYDSLSFITLESSSFKYYTKNLLFSGFLKKIIPSLILLVTCYFQYKLAQKNKPLVRKIIIISTLLFVGYLFYIYTDNNFF